MKIRNPRTGDCDFEIKITDSDRLSEQVNKSRAAQKKWSDKTLDERISVLQELKNSLIRNGEMGCQLRAHSVRQELYLPNRAGP